MNTLVRLVSVAAALGAALVFSGCVTNTSRAPRVKVVEEFEVVESSTEKELTPAQLADLRQAVANYLRGQGLSNDRLYYVKVTFPSANPGEEPQWAVVRIGHSASQTFEVLAAYPGPDDYYPYDYYRAGYHSAAYYPGYAGFSRWGYYDPFDFNYGYYSGHRRHPRDHHKPDKPDGKPGDTPNQPPANSGQNRGGAFPPRSMSPERWARERAERNEGTRPLPARSDSVDRTYTPRPERNYPTRSEPVRSYSPPSEPVRSDPPAPSREENNRIRPEPVER